MKKIALVLLVILFYISSFAQSVSETYTTRDIPTGDGSFDSSCNGAYATLTLNIPAGATVTGVDVVYKMTTGSNSLGTSGNMSDQRSMIYCQETGNPESGYASGFGNEGTFRYSRRRLSLANGTVGAMGRLTFEMRAWRDWTGTAGCNTTINKVDNNTWTVTVHYVNNIPMVYVSSASIQNNTTSVPVCSVNQEIIGLEIEMDGGLNLKDITNLQIEMTGTSNIADISNIDIFYTGPSSTYSPTAPFANATSAAGTIIFSGTQTLVPGKNYFWIAYDLATTATIGNILDAQCTQITIDETNYTPAITNPVGTRAIDVCPGTPGGISSNLTLWLDGSDGANFGGTAASNGGDVDKWMNRQTNLGCPDLNQVVPNEMPLFKENALNFNPVVSFDGGNDQLNRDVLGSDIFSTANNTLFLVHKYYSGTVYFKWEQSQSGNRVGFENDGGTRFDFPTDATGNQNIGTFPYDPKGQIITATVGASNSVLRNMGVQNSSKPISGTLNNSLTSELSIGQNVSFEAPSKVDFAEIIVYNKTLSPIEQNKVESYLAIKYGMTLGINGTSINYHSAAGTTIWDVSANTGFNYDIAGISRDDLADQAQRKSKSINHIAGVDRSILTVANGTNFNTPAMPAADLTHFVWGNNDGATNFSTGPTFTTANGAIVADILDRHWKSQETGTNGTVTLHFDMTNVTNIINWSQLAILVDADGYFTSGATSILPSAISSTGILSIEFEHNFSISEGFFFTLAKIIPTDLQINNPLPVIACDSFILPPITGFNLVDPQYYSDTSGIGTILPVGRTIFKDTVIYLYDKNVGLNEFDQDTLYITINNSNTGIKTVSTCDSYQFNGITYTSNNNTAKDTLTNAAGCDSIITLDLTINNNTGIDIVSRCNSYLFNGTTYTSNNNTAKDTLTNAAGCDSIITLDLTININSSGTEHVVACDSYLFNGITYTSNNNTAKDTVSNATGCDSLVTLDLTIINPTTGIDIQTGCGSFTWTNGDGNIYTSNNASATHTISGGAANGCDSTITLNLKIFSAVSISLGDDQYICDEPVLLSPGGNFMRYLWSDNSSDSTLLVYEPGIYSVEVEDNNGCTEASSIELIDDCSSSFMVPNVFSPNGDNQNDMFNAVIENVDSYEMEIFNRWGNSLFQTNSILAGWTGEDASAGTYFYIIKYSYNAKGELVNKTAKGTVTLLK